MINPFLNTTKTKASLVGLLLIMVVAGYSQQIRFKEPLRESVHTQSILQDGDYYYAVGQYLDPIINQFGVNLLKIDTLGNLVKETRLIDTLFTIYPSNHISIEKTFDGAFITVIGKGLVRSILKFDSNVDTVALYTPILDNFKRAFQQVKQLPDSGFVITGYYYDQPKNMYHADLIRTDKNGNLLWEKIYKEPDSVSLDPYQVYLAPDGGFLIAGHRVYLPDYQTADPLLLKVDSAGNELWRQSYGGSQVDGLACAAYRDDGNIMLHYTQGVQPLQQAHKLMAVFSLVDDSTGQEIFKKPLQFVSVRDLYSNHLIKNGSKFIATGSLAHQDASLDGGVVQTYTLAIKSNFDDLWYRYYNGQGSFARPDDWSVLYDLRPTMDGGYISGGYFLTFDTTHLDVNLGYNGWIVKMDSMGCVEQSPCINRIGIEEQTAQESLAFEVYPNPSSGVINVKLATEANGTATLYDLKGVKLSETELVKGVGILNPPASIAAGIYVIHAVDEGGNHTSEKVIIQK